MKLKIKVKTNSQNNEIIKENDNYLVKLKAKPIEGEANKELIKILSKYFKKQVRIVNGFRSKNKTIEIN